MAFVESAIHKVLYVASARAPGYLNTAEFYVVAGVLTQLTLGHLLSAGNAKRAIKQLWDFLLPKSVFSKKSFAVDLQFFVFNELGLQSTLLKFLAMAVFLRRLPAFISATHLDRTALVLTSRAWISSFSPAHGMFLIFVLAFLCHDFFSYWAHRLVHSFSLLWTFHKVHHNAAQINLLTSYRSHPIDSFILDTIPHVFTGFLLVCLTPLGESQFFSSYSPFIDEKAWWYFGFMLYNSYFSRLSHSQFPIYFGKFFGKLLVSPAFHLVHHSKIYTHHNFGGMFSLWDYIFGTFHDVPDRKSFDFHMENMGVVELPDGGYTNIFQALCIPMKDAYVIIRDGCRTEFNRLRL